MAHTGEKSSVQKPGRSLLLFVWSFCHWGQKGYIIASVLDESLFWPFLTVSPLPNKNVSPSKRNKRAFPRACLKSRKGRKARRPRWLGGRAFLLPTLFRLLPAHRKYGSKASGENLNLGSHLSGTGIPMLSSKKTSFLRMLFSLF